jgi:hypothetical protein
MNIGDGLPTFLQSASFTAPVAATLTAGPVSSPVASTSTAEPVNSPVASTSTAGNISSPVADEITPRTALKRKLTNLSLPKKKLRTGRAKKTSALGHFNFRPKSFTEKSKEEQAYLIISWLAGPNHADSAIKNKIKITEDIVNTIPEQVSTAILEDEVEKVIPSCKSYFDEDGWIAAMNLSNTF